MLDELNMVFEKFQTFFDKPCQKKPTISNQRSLRHGRKE